ncbi:MAG: glycosyltransferase family 4 protein [Rivularia sp. (in: cyanobacteria)]
MKVKITHVIYIPRLSGAEILVKNLSKHHISQSHEVSIISLKPVEDSFKQVKQELESYNVITSFPKRDVNKLKILFHLTGSLRKHRPDIVVAHSVIPSLYTRLALKFTKQNYISTISVLHDASQDDYASSYFQTIEKFLKPSDYVIPLTKRASENYKRNCGNRSKVKIIPNGIDLQALSTSTSKRESLRANVFEAQPSDPIFLQVGRFNRNKQQHLSIQAFIQSCKSKTFNGKLFLAGLIEDREYFSQLNRMVNDANLQNKVIFLGPRSDIPDLLSAADVYLMPSSIEAHSIAFLEALANGITMVISDIPAFEKGKQFSGVISLQPENIQQFARILVQLSTNIAIKRWQRDLSEFSIEKTADIYLQVFNSLLAV